MPNRYGKAAIRLVKVTRDPDRHRVRDLTVAVALEGDFRAAHTEGDNANVIATDTMKNTVYAFAAEHLDGPAETFGALVAGHFLEMPQVERATVSLREHRWTPIPTDGGPSRDAFLRSGDFTRTASATAVRGGPPVVEAGIEDLTVMKTARSGFAGLPPRRLHDAARGRRPDHGQPGQRDLALRLGGPRLGRPVRRRPGTLLDVLADHISPSVQASIWIMGRAILERHAAVEEVRMALPNLHHWAVDLAPFGLENRARSSSPRPSRTA